MGWMWKGFLGNGLGLLDRHLIHNNAEKLFQKDLQLDFAPKQVPSKSFLPEFNAPKVEIFQGEVGGLEAHDTSSYNIHDSSFSWH